MSYHSAPPLQEAGISIFKSVIYESLRKDIASAIINLINQVRPDPSPTSTPPYRPLSHTLTHLLLSPSLLSSTLGT